MSDSKDQKHPQQQTHCQEALECRCTIDADGRLVCAHGGTYLPASSVVGHGRWSLPGCARCKENTTPPVGTAAAVTMSPVMSATWLQYHDPKTDTAGFYVAEDQTTITNPPDGKTSEGLSSDPHLHKGHALRYDALDGRLRSVVFRSYVPCSVCIDKEGRWICQHGVYRPGGRDIAATADAGWLLAHPFETAAWRNQNYGRHSRFHVLADLERFVETPDIATTLSSTNSDAGGTRRDFDAARDSRMNLIMVYGEDGSTIVPVGNAGPFGAGYLVMNVCQHLFGPLL